MEHYFYSKEIYDNSILLSVDEAQHAIKVLRKKNGDKLFVVDGFGGFYNASIESDNINDCRLKILSASKNYRKKNFYIHIALAPPKSHDRLEIFIEKAVEIGIQEISFIVSDHSERNNIKINRINKLIVSAMKQSLRAYLPKINDIISMDNFINKCSNTQKFIACLGLDNNSHLINNVEKTSDYCIMIGPEGGFSDSEISKSLEYEFKSVSLGESRLRTETAAIAACHLLNFINYE